MIDARSAIILSDPCRGSQLFRMTRRSATSGKWEDLLTWKWWFPQRALTSRHSLTVYRIFWAHSWLWQIAQELSLIISWSYKKINWNLFCIEFVSKLNTTNNNVDDLNGYSQDSDPRHEHQSYTLEYFLQFRWKLHMNSCMNSFWCNAAYFEHATLPEVRTFSHDP